LDYAQRHGVPRWYDNPDSMLFYPSNNRPVENRRVVRSQPNSTPIRYWYVTATTVVSSRVVPGYTLATVCEDSSLWSPCWKFDLQPFASSPGMSPAKPVRVPAGCRDAARNPDIVALQEVRPSTAPRLLAALAKHGLPYRLETASAAGDAGRRYGVLLASRWPLQRLPHFTIPYVERVLSALVTSPWGTIEIHTAHIPPGAGNGWKKIETFEGIYEYLTIHSKHPRILCDDFNSPQHETHDGQLITWGQRIRAGGTVTIYPDHDRWDAGERSVLEGLRDFDMPDVFRAVNKYGMEAWSWRFLGRGKQIGRRFDHIFASRVLRPTAVPTCTICARHAGATTRRSRPSSRQACPQPL
jgi:exonuclease III